MKKIIIYAAVFLMISLCSCKTQLPAGEERGYSETLLDWVFCGSNASLDFFIELDSVALDGSRQVLMLAENTEGQIVKESWIEVCTACKASDAYSKVDALLSEFENTGIQLKIVPSGDGSRKIYHRMRQLD